MKRNGKNRSRPHRKKYPDNPASGAPPALLNAPEGTGLLIVDDDENVIKSLEFIFRDKYRVFSCYSGREALIKFKQYETSIDAVLLDIKMDDRDGISVFEDIKKINPSLPVIFNTAYPGEYKPLDLLQTLHPFGYIIKGSDPSMLYDNIASAVEHYRLIKEKDVLNRRLKVLVEDLKKLHSASQKITVLLDRKLLHQEISGQLRGLFASWDVLYFHYDSFRWKLVNESFSVRDPIRKTLLRLSRILIREVEKTQKTARLKDLAGEERIRSLIARHRCPEYLRDLAAAPVMIRNGLSGIVVTANRDPGRFSSESDDYIIRTLSNQIGIALCNLVMIEERIKNMELSVIGKMTSSVIHDISNPLMFIMNGLDLIKAKAGKAAQAHISDMIAEIDRITTMIADLSEFVRKGSSRIELSREKVNALILDYCGRVRKSFSEKGVQMELDLQYNDSLLLDKNKFIRVLQNLLNNAADAMEGGGKVAIATRQAGKFLEIRISDTGRGMDENTRHRIFEPFFSANKKNGLGLGLTIVRQIIAQHRGIIEVESRINKGTLFIIRLPAVKGRR